MSPYCKQGIRIAYLYVSWLGMLATHEAGHVLHAWLSGGQVVCGLLPWFGFSRTDVSPNPQPLFVAWGGAIWGNLIPLALPVMATALHFRFVRWVELFAGFCLVANGAYLAAGLLIGAGDGGGLMRHGASQWALLDCLAWGAGCFVGTGLGCRNRRKHVWSQSCRTTQENSVEPLSRAHTAF